MPTTFRHVKRITTEPNSIFYTLLKLPDNKFIGFGRKNCPARILKKVILNDKLDIIEDKNETFRGEDPRSFYLNNKMYVIDNYYNDMYLIEHDATAAQKFTKIRMSGKNLSFIPHDGKLYFMHYIKPFVLIRVIQIRVFAKKLRWEIIKLHSITNIAEERLGIS
jgi:hypothetical protein